MSESESVAVSTVQGSGLSVGRSGSSGGRGSVSGGCGGASSGRGGKSGGCGGASSGRGGESGGRDGHNSKKRQSHEQTSVNDKQFRCTSCGMTPSGMSMSCIQ